MDELTIAFKIESPPSWLPIGRTAENNWRAVEIDCSYWFNMSADGSVVLMYKPSCGMSPYPLLTEREGDNIIWRPKSGELVEGVGRLQAFFEVGTDVIGSSDMISCEVDSSLLGVDPGTDPGQTDLPWALDIIEQIAELSGHYPKIIDGGLYIWDSTLNDWVEFEASGGGAVESVNGKTGVVVLDASDVGALPDDTPIPAAVTEQTVAGWGFTKNTGTYSKPSGGIPKSDLASAVQTSLGKADSAYQKPSGGIPASDLASGVIPSVPQMATQADMSDWTSGKTVDASVLASDFSAAMDALGAKADAYKLNALATFTDGGDAVVPLFTNQLPISTDTDGTIFHGVGYHEGYRFNSSGEEVAATGVSTSGFIPATRDSILRFSDIGMYVEAQTGVSLNHIYVCTYDSNKTFTNAIQLYKILQNANNCMVVESGNATEIDFSKTVDGSYGVRTGTAFVRISAYGVSSDSIITVNEEIAYDEHGEITSATLKSDVSIPQLAPLDARITALEEDEGGGTIDSTDPLAKYAKQIDNGLTVGYEPTLTNRPTANLVAKKYLNFLHISDTHGSVNAENAVKILNKLKADGRCSFLIHTGDFHSSTFADVASWNTFAGYIAQATAPVLLVSGNHDVGNNSQSTTDGTTATDAQLYARCFEPYISGWNLTSHPTGKCYWYKDFADEGVRLIGLYDFESDYATDSNGQLLYKRGYAAYHQAQIDWLVQALLSCPAGYGVIIAKHNPMNKRGTLDSPFNGEFLQGQNTSQSYVSKDMIAEIVQAFMDGTTINKTFAQTGNVTDTLTVNQSFANKNTGAHFICYVDGHTHADGVNFLADFPKQLELNIGCDNYHYQHYADTYNQNGTLHQDLLNYVSVDVNRGYVYIQRIGNDYTAQADRRDFTAIDYKNPPVVVDFPEVDASDDGKVWGVSGGQYGLIASPTPTEPVLEEICTIVGDGTRPFITTDKNGEPFALKKMVVKAEITDSLSAAGNFSFHGMSGTAGISTSLCSLYFSWSASATNRFKAEGVLWQENGFWRQTSYGFSNNGYGAINGTYAYDFALSTADYPAIRAVDSGSVVPAGITIKVYGVRA